MLTFKELEVRHDVEITGYVEKIFQRKVINIITLKMNKERQQKLLSIFNGSKNTDESISIISTGINKVTLLERIDKVLFECDMFTELSLTA